MSSFFLYIIFVYNKTCVKVFCGWLVFCLLFIKQENKQPTKQEHGLHPTGSLQIRKVPSLTDLGKR